MKFNIKSGEVVIFQCKSPQCRLEFQLILEPQVKANISRKAIGERCILNCPFCGGKKLELINKEIGIA